MLKFFSRTFTGLLLLSALFTVKAQQNPLLYHYNQPIQFDKLTAGYVQQATDAAFKTAQDNLKKIYDIPGGKRTFENTMIALDNVYNDLSNVYGPIYLMSNAHPDDSVRNQCSESSEKFSNFFTVISLDEKLYKAVKDYSQSDEAKKLTGYKAKFTEETVRNFERNGFALSKEKRDELQVIQDSLSALSVDFEKNIAENKDFLIVEEKDIDGLPDDYKAQHKTDDGKYKIDLSYPSYVPFMKYAKSDDARKNLYMLFNNRAKDKNLTDLQNVLIERQKLAVLLGYKTYAAYQVEDRMAKTTKTVWDFENNLIDKVKEKARKDYDELLEVKRAYLKDNSITVVQPYEAGFYNNLLLMDKYNVDQQEVKEYFELNHVLDGLFQISQHLYDVKFEEVKNPSVWHKDVRMFNVIQDGKVISQFYLDLYPRDNKYSHAACFPIISGKMTPEGYQMPIAALECNFPMPTADKPSLMTHGDAETFFHEFGHVLHSVLTKAELSSYAGTSVARDFVEAPSQFYENYVWNYESLSLFAKHYKTGEVMPKALFDKVLAAKNVGSGISTLQQILYGILDMTYHDKYNPEGSETTTDVLKNLQNEITLYPFLEGTHMQASFGHLMGYAAGYYGYLWSLVYAEDIYSVFEKNGVMDKTTGKRFRDIILAQGGSKKEMDLIKEFLQREPNQDAFLKSLGL